MGYLRQLSETMTSASMASAYRRMRGSCHWDDPSSPLARETWTQRPRGVTTPQSPQPRTTRGPRTGSSIRSPWRARRRPRRPSGDVPGPRSGRFAHREAATQTDGARSECLSTIARTSETQQSQGSCVACPWIRRPPSAIRGMKLHAGGSVRFRPWGRAIRHRGFVGRTQTGRPFLGLSSRFGGDSPVRERDLDACAAEVNHRDQRGGGVEAVCAV